MAMALNGVRGFGRFRPSDPEVILPVHGQGIRLFIRRSGVDLNLVKSLDKRLDKLDKFHVLCIRVSVNYWFYVRLDLNQRPPGPEPMDKIT